MLAFLFTAIITGVIFFNQCVSIVIKIRTNEDVGADRVFASVVLIIFLYTTILLSSP